MPKPLLAALFVNVRYSVEKGCLQAVAASVVKRRGDKRQLVEEERIKQGFVRLANGRPDPFLSDCPFSDGLKFLNRGLMKGHRLSSDFHIYLFWKLQSLTVDS